MFGTNRELRENYYWVTQSIPKYKAAAKSLQSCPTLCGPTDGSPAGSLVPWILQARTLEWVAISFSHESEKWKWSRSVCPTISDPMDCSLPGSSVHGIFQARVLEWGAIAFSHLPINRGHWDEDLWKSASAILYFELLRTKSRRISLQPWGRQQFLGQDVLNTNH